MEELLFIINPIAGGGKAKKLVDIIEEDMKTRNKSYKIVLTNNPKEATQIAYESNIEKIIAVGGDGTVTEVAKGIIRRGYGVLGIIAGGTGNDLIKSIGLSKDTKEALDIIVNGKSLKIDIGIANGHRFLNIGSVGLDAEVIKHLEETKKFSKGKLSYIVSVFVTLVSFKKQNVNIEIDKKKYNRSLVLFATGNGKFYGGGLQMVPHSKINDGYLHSTLVKDIHNLRIATIFPEIFRGTHIRHKKYVETFKSKTVKITSQKDMYMNLDGELFFAGKEIDFSLADDKLEVLIL